MTEDEAKGKWCPFARVDSTGSNRMNLGYSPSRDPFCLGSACMAWRWREQMASVTSGSEPRRSFIGAKAQYENAAGWRVEPLPPEGFCGLAGAPQ